MTKETNKTEITKDQFKALWGKLDGYQAMGQIIKDVNFFNEENVLFVTVLKQRLKGDFTALHHVKFTISPDANIKMILGN